MLSLRTLVLLTSLAAFILPAFVSSQFTNSSRQCESARYATKPNVFVLTDISNEPDDQMSLVRFLTYANELNILGIAATTSTWLRNATDRAAIEAVISGYEQVVDNLNANVPSYAPYPSAEDLLSKVSSANPVYGLQTFDYPTSEAALQLLEAASAATVEEPLWVTAWGGAAVLAEALKHATDTQGEDFVQGLIPRLRVYAISDQDDTGVWIRQNYPKLFFIVSLHGFSEYTQATWTGISGEVLRQFDKGGPDTSLVTNEWLQEYIRIGPLGAYYLNWTYIMEGDTPSFLPLIQNGLGDLDHPDWGSWGGRYVRLDDTNQTNIYSNAADFVVGQNNDTFITPFGTIWRWRRDFQYDFAARMAWTVEGDHSQNNHNPIAIVNGSCGLEPWHVPYKFGDVIHIDASESWDPDSDELNFKWFHYRDPAQRLEGDIAPVSQNVTITPLTDNRSMVALTPKDNITMHIILSLEDVREMPLTSYRRIILEPTS